MNINPVANGNKTQTGTGGLLTVALGAAVYAVLKQMGIDDKTGMITGAVVSSVSSGVLFVIGYIHRLIKARKK